MKKLAFVVAAMSLFVIAPMANRFGPVASSVALVWLGVLLAVCASGTASSMAVASGAVGAFGSGVLASVSPAAAGAIMLAAAFAERTTRIRSRTARAVHVLVALVGGALAGSLATSFSGASGASTAVTVVAIMVAAVLSALPLLVEADDPVAHALEQAASSVGEPAKASLMEGAELRRTSQEAVLDSATQARVKKTWQSLLRLAEARVRLERSRPKTAALAAAPLVRVAEPTAADAVLVMVDQRLAEHVAVLSKAIVAVDTMHAAALGLEDADLRTVDSMGDSLDDVSRAMVEVKGASAT